ncbi:hypothetical protein [uncultured Phascolarctobacterium sp.]|uniref:hypothetical protein n=1 Tax=uncultured Phascolarctobacterium sp. TaxID=512296 RepID=UPI0025F20C0C|nr:hypothetical protein [uncultured Phascolarctobacterium sp.]
MFEVSAGYAQHSILIFHVMPSCPERGQRVKRNPNLNSAESSLRRLLSRKRHNKKENTK